MSEIVFLVDAEVSSDILRQAVVLAEGVNGSEDLRGKIVVCGAVGEDSAIRRQWPGLGSSGRRAAEGGSVIHLRTGKGAGPLGLLDVLRSKVFSGCGVVHCLSPSLLEGTGGFGVGAWGRRCCLSLPYWPGKTASGGLAKWSDCGTKRVVCATESLRAALAGCGVRREKCVVIGPEPPGDNGNVERSAARELLGLTDENDVVLAGSEMSFSSNHRELAWAAAIIGQFSPKFRVLVPGCGKGVERLREFDDSLNPPSLGVYPGEKFEPAVLYAAADAVVVPATGPASPVGIWRAGRAGLPVVANADPWLNGCLRQEENALLYSPKNIRGVVARNRRIRPLAGAICRVLADRELSKRLGEQLGKDVEGHFCRGRCAEEHLRLYREMLAES